MPLPDSVVQTVQALIGFAGPNTRYSVSQSENGYTINFPVVFSGTDATPNARTAYSQAITNWLSGDYNGTHITVNVVDHSDDLMLTNSVLAVKAGQYTNLDIAPLPPDWDSRPAFSASAGGMIYLPPLTTDPTDWENALQTSLPSEHQNDIYNLWASAHEALHAMGLPDEYVGATGPDGKEISVPIVGQSGMMAQPFGSPTPDDWDTLLRGANIVQPGPQFSPPDDSDGGIDNLLKTPMPGFPTDAGTSPDQQQGLNQSPAPLDDFDGSGTDFTAPDSWAFKVDPGPTAPVPLDPASLLSSPQTAPNQNDSANNNVSPYIPPLSISAPAQEDDSFSTNARQDALPAADTDPNSLESELHGEPAINDDSLQVGSNPPDQSIADNDSPAENSAAVGDLITEDDPPKWNPTPIDWEGLMNANAAKNSDREEAPADEPLDLGLPRTSAPDLGVANVAKVDVSMGDMATTSEALFSGSPI